VVFVVLFFVAMSFEIISVVVVEVMISIVVVGVVARALGLAVMVLIIAVVEILVALSFGTGSIVVEVVVFILVIAVGLFATFSFEMRVGIEESATTANVLGIAVMILLMMSGGASLFVDLSFGIGPVVEAATSFIIVGAVAFV